MPAKVDTNLALLLSAGDAAALLGVSRSLFYGMYSSGRLGPMPVKLGSRTLWRRKELETWTDAGCPTRDLWYTMKDNEN